MTDLTGRRNAPDQSAGARNVLAAVLADAAAMVHLRVAMMMTVPMTTDAEDGTVGHVAPDAEMILHPIVTTNLVTEIPLQKKTIPRRPTQVPDITASSYRNSTEPDHGNLGGPTSRTVLPTVVGQSTTSWLS